MRITGRQFGIEIIKRNDAPNDAIQILSEDDDNWHPHGNIVDAAWIDDLIDVLQLSKTKVKIGYKP